MPESPARLAVLCNPFGTSAGDITMMFGFGRFLSVVWDSLKSQEDGLGNTAWLDNSPSLVLML